MIKVLRSSLPFLALLLLPHLSQAVHWHTDFENARRIAALSGRPLYAAFLGTDWSLSSKRWESRILQSAQFEDFAHHHLTLLRIEANRLPESAKDVRAEVWDLIRLFDVRSYPRLFLVGPDGQTLIEHGYLDLKADEYVENLRLLLPPETIERTPPSPHP